jgi:hypothetical protein
MMRITSSLLTDTLNVITLARETALARGGQAQAERLTPVVEGLRSLASAAPAAPVASGAPAALNVAPSDSLADKAAVITAMSAGGMGDVDISRQLGMTREEVQLMLAVSKPHTAQPGLPAANSARRYSA